MLKSSYARTMLGVIAGAIALAVAMSACASAGAGTRKSSCGLLPRDSVYLADGPVYRECSVDRPATVISHGMHDDFRPSNPSTRCYSAELEFVVDTRGKPEMTTARVVRTSDRAFGDAVMSTLSTWTYDPARLGGVPVRQIVSSRQTMQTVLVRAGSGPPGPPLTPPMC